MRPAAQERLSPVSGESQHSIESIHESPAESSELEAPTPPLVSESQDDRSKDAVLSPLSQSSGVSLPTLSRGRSPPLASQRPLTTGTASQREVEDLRIKMRLMEKKRMEDREKLKALDKVQAERDRFEGIIQKMQSKYQPQQYEITELKKQLKEMETRYQTLESQQAENDSINEMATLDREMAEETAESLKTELDNLRQIHEELELEAEVLREENQELSKEMSPEEKTSQGWLQMEREKDRYREALMRLREVTQQGEADLKEQVAELEKDLEELKNVKNEHILTKEQLSQSESTLVELREQLDSALGGEEMIEELTDKNMILTEKIDELRQNIEELESLKELNDELEVNHMETEKQLQDEIDYHESLLAKEASKSAIQDGTIQDLEYTVARFRDLVSNMQSDLEDMRASQQISETEANELSQRSRAMMDLNMRLQVSASKSQVKAIELELGKMEAQESSEHLAIVQLLLPESFKSERDSVQALLRFRRIGFKANMMHHFIKERMHGQATQEDDIFPCCDILDKLTWISSTCNRFISNIETCDLEAFRRIGGASYELDPVERAFNVWVDGLKRDELKSEQCAIELQRSIALMSHLAEVHVGEGLAHYADELNMRATMIQSYFENSATALSHIKTVSEAKVSTTSIESDEENADYEEFVRKLDALISQTRSAKVVSSKSIRQLQDLKSRSLTLEPSTLSTIETAQNAASELSSITRTAGMTVLQLVTDEARNVPVTYEVLLDQTPFSSLTAKLHSATGQLQTFYNLTSNLTQTIEFPSPPPPPPWKLIAQNMQAATAEMLARESELARLKDEVAEKNTTLAIQEKIAEEMSVKIEVLEKRVGESGGRREKVRELEAAVEAAVFKEKDLLGKLAYFQNELRSFEVEREKWKQSPQAAVPTSQLGQATVATTSPAVLLQIDALKSEIKTLQSSIRYLRSASYNNTLSSTYEFLSRPLVPAQPPPSHIQTEAKDVLKEMLNLASQSESQVVRLQPRNKADRLRWRPARETSGWKTQHQREEWEEWREWRDGVARKSAMGKKEEERRRGARSKNAAREREPLASVQVQLPSKMGSGLDETKVVRSKE